MKSAPFSPHDPVTVLPGVGPKRAETLDRLGIKTIEDLLRHYPHRYEDRRRAVPVGTLVDGEAALARVHVRRVIKAPGFRGGKVSAPMKVVCGDESGEMTLLFFNAKWLGGAFREGYEYWVYGTPRRDIAGVSMAHPDFEAVQAERAGAEDCGSATGLGIIPVYPLTAGVSQRYIRSLVRSALPVSAHIAEMLPEEFVKQRRLAPSGFALTQIHNPGDDHALNAARYRLIYEEFFLLQVRLLHARDIAGAETAGKGMATCTGAAAMGEAAGLFPFELTMAQWHALKDIRKDMAAPLPMRRLLQGDVGSGKTAVMAAAVLFASRSGFQTAIMAPTEILAAQHYADFTGFFHGAGVNVALLTSGLSPVQKQEAKEGIKNGDVHVVIGTHALIEPDVAFSRLGLVVTDEQHRFGVRQRLRLREKGSSPDTLVMTATPIPRTMALMLYADLDVSVIDEMPPGRKAVTTRFTDSSKRDAAYDFAEREMGSGRQVYVVAASIGSAEVLDLDLRGVEGLLEEMKERFPHRRLAALHGQMKSGQKEEIMRMFVAGEIDMLVSTVVIEVGVNVPNATLMIVENAERFGLAQLHQLRGRVGRGAEKSYCVLISDSKSGLAAKRGEALAKENDGFRIAELDLTLRGPGDIFGVRQHGLPEFKIADPARHMDILKLANQDAKALFADGAADGALDCRVASLLAMTEAGLSQ